MPKRVFAIFLLLLLSFKGLKAQDSYETRARNYVSLYKDLAIEEQRRSGVPAAITLAQGIHETSGGQSELADNANNHFGIKCKSDWTGQTYSYTDDRPHECFRKYERVEDSYHDHSDYLANSPRYASLFKLAVTDYTNWAKGLKNLGYATNPKYAQILIKLVEDYGLQEFTLAALKALKKQSKETKVFATAYTPQNAKTNATEQNKKVTTTTGSSNKKSMSVSYDQVVSDPVYHYEPTAMPEPEKQETIEPVIDGSETMVNGMKAFYAKKGSMLLHDAVRFNLRYAKLLEYNDLPDGPLSADMFVYLERKKPTGAHETHVVKKGETLFMIAQKEGIQLKALRALNKIEANEEPAVGAMLQLITMSLTKPSVIVKQIVASSTSPKIMLTDSVKTDNGFISKKELEQAKLASNQKQEVKKENSVAAKNTNTKNTAKETMPSKKEEKKEPAIVVVKNTPAIEVPVEEKKTEAVIPSAELQQVAPKPVERKHKTNDPSLSAYVRQAMEEAGNDSKDEYAVLKEKLDKLVYANGNPIDEEEVVDNLTQQELANAEFYTVQKGETAFSIAKKFNLTMQQLQDLNQLGFNEIKAGQKLRVK